MPYRKEVRRAIGRRGLLLMLFGTAWVLFGTQVATNPQPRFANPATDSDAILMFMERPEWGWVWVVVGVFSIVAGFLRNRRPFFGNDEHGYQFVVMPPAMWTLFYLWSWMAYLISGGEIGRSGASLGLTLWALFSAIILTISGWPEEMMKTDEEEHQVRSRHLARKRRRSGDG